MRSVALALLAGLAVPAVAQTASPLHLIPMPREVTFKGDQPVTGFTVECPNCGPEDQFAASDLRDELAARGVPSGNGLRIVLQRLGQHPDPSFTPAMQPEGYTIASAPDALTLTGATGAGIFYAAQTLKQMIERQPNGSFVLHAAEIRDWPAMHYRGLSDDLSRGPVDTLEFQKKLDSARSPRTRRTCTRHTSRTRSSMPPTRCPRRRVAASPPMTRASWSPTRRNIT